MDSYLAKALYELATAARFAADRIVDGASDDTDIEHVFELMDDVARVDARGE